jgi:cytochrome b subunit of formate dehydrogenase
VIIFRKLFQPEEEQMRNLPHNSANFSSPLRKLAAVVATAAVIGMAVMFSVVLIAVILLVGSIALSYLWWKTRDLRKQMRNYPARDVVMNGEISESGFIKGEVIEGEAIRVVDTREAE